MCYPYKVVLTVYNPDGSKDVFEDFGREEDQSMFLRTAKRILNNLAGIEGDGFIAQKRIDYLPVNQISKEIKAAWPQGLKTVLVYYFEFNK